MQFTMICPNLRCRKLLHTPEDARGKTVKCQHCQTMLRVPLKRAEPAPVVGAAPAGKK